MFSQGLFDAYATDTTILIYVITSYHNLRNLSPERIDFIIAHRAVSDKLRVNSYCSAVLFDMLFGLYEPVS